MSVTSLTDDSRSGTNESSCDVVEIGHRKDVTEPCCKKKPNRFEWLDLYQQRYTVIFVPVLPSGSFSPGDSRPETESQGSGLC